MTTDNTNTQYPIPDTSKPELSFETAMSQLTDLVKKIETGALPLADSIKAYETGKKLKAFLEQTLKEAELKIEKIEPTSSSDK